MATMRNNDEASSTDLLGTCCHICGEHAVTVCLNCLKLACSDHTDDDFKFCADCFPQRGYTP